MARPLRVANVSGFYGDRLAAPREMLAGPEPVDVLTGDYLAELTMLILWKARRRDPSAGYAATFLRQMEEVLGTCLDRGVKVVTNAGGLNPDGLAERLHELADRLGLSPRVAVVEGDDVRHLFAGAVTANAYLGGWGIAEGLAAGADVVVCGRVADASLAVGPAAWWHGWDPSDWDALAGAVVAGHVIECGAQATGGNYAFIEELPRPARYPGFPIAEIAADGSAVITKQPGTGGMVTTGTVTAQLLYEIAEPAYVNPDVVARFDTIQLDQVGPDRVRISGARGEPPPDTLKVACTFEGGWRNTMTLVLTGLDIEAKAEMALAMLDEVLGGLDRFAACDVSLIRADRPDPPSNEQAVALLRIAVKDPDPAGVGRRFSAAVTELALASYPGMFMTAPPSDASEYGVYRAAFVPAGSVAHTVVLPDGTRRPIPHPTGTRGEPVQPLTRPLPPVPGGPTVKVALGRVCGARSGDKGGDANVGVWARTDEAYAWLARTLTPDRFRQLVPEAADLEVRRYELPNIRALNFVVVGLLGEGVAATTRFDAQAKGLGEYLRARLVEVPAALLDRC